MASRPRPGVPRPAAPFQRSAGATSALGASGAWDRSPRPVSERCWAWRARGDALQRSQEEPAPAGHDRYFRGCCSVLARAKSSRRRCRDSGFPPLMLDPVDFVGPYRQNMERQAAKNDRFRREAELKTASQQRTLKISKTTQ